MLYLIHFSEPLGRAQHYLGYCEAHRLHERLLEHARGRGAALTRAAVQTGRKLYLARTVPDGTPAMERRYKTRGDFRRACPFCCLALKGLMSQTYEIDANRPEQPARSAITEY